MNLCYNLYVVTARSGNGKGVFYLDIVSSLVVGVVAGVICHLICKWLNHKNVATNLKESPGVAPPGDSLCGAPCGARF